MSRAPVGIRSDPAHVGIATQPGPIHTADPATYNDMFRVNTLGPLYMYQATYPLLIETRVQNSTLPAPKFFITSSALGSLGGFFDAFIVAPYGISKAAVNYLALSIHHQTEHVGAVVVPYHPGTSPLHPHTRLTRLTLDPPCPGRPGDDRHEHQEQPKPAPVAAGDLPGTKRGRVRGADREFYAGRGGGKVPGSGVGGAVALVDAVLLGSVEVGGRLGVGWEAVI